MLPYLIVLFTVLPALELYVLITVGSHIGALNTILIVIVTGVVGASLAKSQGLMVVQKIQSNLNQGILPSSELIDAMMILAGGIVLLTPGFISDVIGILLLIPATRAIIKVLVRKRMERMIQKGQTIHFRSRTDSHKRYDDIDI